jgi:polar amino acid transport system permease protein
MDFGYNLDFWYLVRHAGELALGLGWTVAITAVGIAGGVVLGFAGAVVRVERVRGLALVVAALVEFIRTTPLFVQIFFLYFGLPEIGLDLDALGVACVALVVWGGAYNVENFRAAIESVPRSWREAAAALGLRRFQIFRLITAPVAVRIAMPSLTNTAIEILKGSALMVAISFPELTDTGINLVAVSFRVFEVFIALAAAYLLLAAGLARGMRALESRLAWPG